MVEKEEAVAEEEEAHGGRGAWRKRRMEGTIAEKEGTGVVEETAEAEGEWTRVVEEGTGVEESVDLIPPN